jgi:uncharacterized protein
MAIALAISVAVSLVIYNQHTLTVNSLSTDLAEKSLQADQQMRVIEENSSMLATQHEELVQMTRQLDQMQTEIASLEQEIESQITLIAEKSAQAQDLEQQISLLQSEIQSRDQDLARIMLENDSVRGVQVTHYGLGVDKDDKGIVFPIDVEIIESGEGRISVNISDVQFEPAFQDAVRTAAVVASAYTGITVSDKDIIVTLVNDSGGLIKVDGPSAGAVLAALIAAGLEEKQLDHSILVTGTIRQDGTIGRVGGLPGKADAAVEFGAAKLLVPRGQVFPDDRIVIVGVADIKQLASLMIV